MVSHPGDWHLGQRGRHRARRTVRKGVLVSLVGVIAAGGAIGAVALRTPSRSTAANCADPPPALRVAAAPEIAGAVAAVAHRVSLPGCGEIRVRSADPATIAAMVRRGTGAARADVWIPDSSLWLQGLRVPTGSIGPSIARSPIVVALDTHAAGQLRPAPSFDALAAAATTAHPIPLAAGNVPRSARALGALVGLYTNASKDPADLGNLGALLRTASAVPSAPARSQPPTRLPARPPTVQGQAVAIPTSEQAVWSANAAAKADRYTAIYAPVAGPSLDYPVVVLTKKSAATALLTKLGSPRGRQTIGRYGFRAFDGIAPPQLLHAPGIRPTASAAVGAPTHAQLAAVLKALNIVQRPSRMLAVIDVSGSMAAAVAGAPGRSRIDVARAAAKEGLALLPSQSAVGLWRFSTDLTGSTDYEQLVAIAPLTDATRRRLATAVHQLRAVPNGGTGLYDTILAAVREMRTSYDPTRVNSVVVLSDGKDEADSDHGISEADLLAQLNAERRSDRPVKVVAIAYGPDSDATALRAISAASGGSAYISADPRDLPKVLANAIGQRLCEPAC